MILLVSVVAGVMVGWLLAGRRQVRYEAPALRHLWLAMAAFLPQYIVIYLPLHSVIPDWVAAICLVISQLLFLGFAFLNFHHQGMKVLMIGMILNFVVMVANFGFMPISPQTASRLVRQEVLMNASSGNRFGAKDILLRPEETRFEFLADRFLAPTWSPYQVAFSLGDVFVAAGAFWLLSKQERRI